MKKLFPLATITCLLIWVVQPANQIVESLVHFGYTEFGSVAIALPVNYDDAPEESFAVEEVIEPEVAEGEPAWIDYDLTKPYRGQKIGDGVITSPQGPRRAPCAGCSTYHQGADWAKTATGGEPLYAPAKVEVVCKVDNSGGGGNYAEFSHNGMLWQLLHLQPGSCVAGGHEKGWIIGRVGGSGRVSGPHLHLQLRGPSREFLHVGTGHVAAVVIKQGA